jgi:hypothetical protein
MKTISVPNIGKLQKYLERQQEFFHSNPKYCKIFTDALSPPNHNVSLGLDLAEMPIPYTSVLPVLNVVYKRYFEQGWPLEVEYLIDLLGNLALVEGSGITQETLAGFPKSSRQKSQQNNNVPRQKSQQNNNVPQQQSQQNNDNVVVENEAVVSPSIVPEKHSIVPDWLVKELIGMKQNTKDAVSYRRTPDLDSSLDLSSDDSVLLDERNTGTFLDPINQKARGTFLGGSNAYYLVAGVNGLQRWENQSLRLLFQEKVDATYSPPFTGNDSTRYGQAREQFLVEKARHYGKFVNLHKDHFVTNAKYPHIAASIDALGSDDDGVRTIIEAKTTKNSPTTWGFDGAALTKVPVSYFVQVLHYMLLTGIKDVLFVAEFRVDVSAVDPSAKAEIHFFHLPQISNEMIETLGALENEFVAICVDCLKNNPHWNKGKQYIKYVPQIVAFPATKLFVQYQRDMAKLLVECPLVAN